MLVTVLNCTDVCWLQGPHQLLPDSVSPAAAQPGQGAAAPLAAGRAGGPRAGQRRGERGRGQLGRHQQPAGQRGHTRQAQAVRLLPRVPVTSLPLPLLNPELTGAGTRVMTPGTSDTRPPELP